MSIPGTIQVPALSSTPSAPPLGSYIVYAQSDNTFRMEDSGGNVYVFGGTSFISSLTGDVLATGPGAAAATVVALQGSAISNVAPTDAQMLLWVTGTSKWTPTSLNGDATINDSGTLTIPSNIVTAKLLTGYVTGTNTPILATNSILTAFENLQGQVSATIGSAITSLTGDISATGPGAAAATIESIQGTAVSGTTGSINVVFSNAPTLTGLLSGGSASFSSTISASNLSGINTGDVTTTNTNSINLAFISGQSGLNATLNLSASSPDAGYIPALSQIKTDGLLVEVLAGLPVNIGTTNSAGSAASAARSDHVHALTTSVTTGQLLTGYVTGTNTPILATNSILTAFENLQAQVSATIGSAITSLTGDGTATGPGSSVFVLATVNSNIGSFGSSTSIPSFTVNGKGLITAASSSVVIAPAGTLTGTVLASNVVDSSLTSVGTIITGVWNGTALTAPYMLALPTNNIYVGNGSNQPAAVSMSGDIAIIASGVTTIQTNVVSNAKLAQAPTNTLKGNNTGVTANVTDLTASQVNTLLGTVTTIGTYDSQTSQANGLDIVGNSLYAQSATTTNPGMVNASTQSFSGNKTFTGQTAVANASTTAFIINTTSLVVDSTNNAIGIGIQPATNTAIDILNTSGTSKAFQSTSYGIGSTNVFRGRFARGTSGSPTAVQSGDTLNVFSGRGYGTSQFATASTGVINIVAGETFTNTSNQTYLQFSTTPTGSVVSAESMRVASTGITLGPQSSSTAIHQINGGINHTTRTITASTFTIDTTTTDEIILTDSTSNTINITLPTATNGRVIVIQDKTGQAATNHITITPPGAVTINGVNAAIIIGINYAGRRLISDGTNWTYSVLLPISIPAQAVSASTIDWSTGSMFTKTLSANTTFTFSNNSSGQTIVVRLTNTASNYTVTWPTVRWAAGVAPTMSVGAVSDVYTFLYDGSNVYGSYVQLMS